MRSNTAARVAAVLAFVCVVGCKGAGSGDDPNAPLSGTLRVAEFVVPAGIVRNVTGDLKIFAAGKIDIRGELRVASTASLGLFAEGDLVIGGRILGETGALPGDDGGISRSKPSRKSATRTVTSALEADSPFAAAGANITVEADGVVFKETDMHLSVTAEAGTIRIAGLVRCDSRITVAERGSSGDPGCAVEVGTPRAADAARAQGLARRLATPNRVVISGRVRAGDGNPGHTARSGTLEAGLTRRTFTFDAATNGGEGGSVIVRAGAEINVEGGSIVAGTGGGGGAVMGGDADEISDGVAEGEPGVSVVATLGSGGAGGSVSLSAPQVVGTAGRPGEGGASGTIRCNVGSGGRAGAGGDMSIVLGERGVDGTGPEALSSPVNHVFGILLRGGRGGDSSLDASRMGGRGGTLRFSRIDGAQLPTFLHGTVDDFGNGGHGFDGCIPAPRTAGTAGGRGGDLQANAVIAGLTIARSFNGGNGGHGNGPAQGGASGKNLDTDATLGTVGSNGMSCAVLNPVLTLTKVGTGTGTVTVRGGPYDPQGFVCSSADNTCNPTFRRGDVALLTVVAAPGFPFVGWGGACAGTSPTCTLTMDESKTVTWEIGASPPVLLTLNKAGSGTGSVTVHGGPYEPEGFVCSSTDNACTGTFANGDVVTLTAAAGPGSTFAGWSGACGGSSTTCTLTMDESKNVTWNMSLVLLCPDGFGDCDRVASNACEQPLTTPAHCGACDRTPTEVCDGLDNNCNNQVDEGCPRRISMPSATIVTSPVWGNTQPPGALGSVQGDCFGIGGAVMVGICGDYTTHVRRIGMYCGVPTLVRQTSTVPYTHAITRGASVGCNPQGSSTSGSTRFDFVCPGNMVVRRIFGEASGDLGKVGVECVQLEVVLGTGNTWTLAEGATATSEAYGSGTGTPFSWPPAAPGVAVRGINGTYGIQNPVWALSAIGVTFRLDLYP